MVWAQLAMTAASTVASAYEQKKQKKNLRELKREIQQQKKDALEAIDTSVSQAKSPIQQEMDRMGALRTARAPFMEQAIQQGSFTQAGADRRKAEEAAGGIGGGGRLDVGREIAAQSGQALMAKESMRLKREGELTSAISQQAQGLANIELTGMQSRQEAMRSYGERISGVTDRIGSMKNPWRAGLTSGISGLMGQVGQQTQMAQEAVWKADPTKASAYLDKSFWGKAGF